MLCIFHIWPGLSYYHLFFRIQWYLVSQDLHYVFLLHEEWILGTIMRDSSDGAREIVVREYWCVMFKTNQFKIFCQGYPF